MSSPSKSLLAQFGGQPPEHPRDRLAHGLGHPVGIVEKRVEPRLRPPAPHQPVRPRIDEVDDERAGLVRVGLRRAVCALAVAVGAIRPIDVQALGRRGVIVDEQVGLVGVGELEPSDGQLVLDGAVDVVGEERVGVEPGVAGRQAVRRSPVVGLVLGEVQAGLDVRADGDRRCTRRARERGHRHREPGKSSHVGWCCENDAGSLPAEFGAILQVSGDGRAKICTGCGIIRASRQCLHSRPASLDRARPFARFACSCVSWLILQPEKNCRPVYRFDRPAFIVGCDSQAARIASPNRLTRFPRFTGPEVRSRAVAARRLVCGGHFGGFLQAREHVCRLTRAPTGVLRRYLKKSARHSSCSTVDQTLPVTHR